MMEALWEDILNRFGQRVTLRRGEEETTLKALVQPFLERSGEQLRPGPMGLGRTDRFRYLGPAAQALGQDTLVVWKGQEFRVQSAHLVGEGVCPHWRAVLCPRDEVAL